MPPRLSVHGHPYRITGYRSTNAHASHEGLRTSDSDRYDLVCDNCHRNDEDDSLTKRCAANSPVCSADGCSRREPCGPGCRDRGNFDPCDHRWVDGRDTSTDGYDFCSKCGATQRGLPAALGFVHIDDWIDRVRMPGKDADNEACAVFFFEFARMPAWKQMFLRDITQHFTLYCDWQGKRYRVTGASRMGDVWLTANFARSSGYEHRVNVAECNHWSPSP